MSILAQELARVHERIAAAAARSGRRGRDVTLVAVTKYLSAEHADLIRAATEAGVRHLAENRVQDAAKKIPLAAKFIDQAPPCWHMIGHLQSNKVNKAAELFDRVDSLDRWEIAEMLDSRCGELSKTMQVLWEIKLSGENAKTGLPETDLPSVLERCKNLKNLDVKGLMTMGPAGGDAEAARAVFRRLREIFESVNAQKILPQPLEILSMGMSGDFEIAIEEGATEVRVGQALFGERRHA